MGKGAWKFNFNHPAEGAFGLMVSLFIFSTLLLIFSVGWAIALPWALFASSALTIVVKEPTTSVQNVIQVRRVTRSREEHGL